MRRTAPLWLLLLAGCSTAPIADLMDYFRPGKIRSEQGAPSGGVCIPQGGPIAVPVAIPPTPTPPQPLIAAPPVAGDGIPPPAPPGRPF